MPWADRLWFITYSPHSPSGSSDKLYELTADLQLTARPESIGGTPAGRLIHRESNQLFIGPYAIDAQRNVRAIPYDRMFGRHTAVARHLSEPADKVYYYDMEGLLYEVEVHTLEANLLYKRPLPGWHAKGAYTGQGRLVLANNGERSARSVNRFKPFDYQFDPARTSDEDAGALGDWDGRTWRLIQRRQFTEVTTRGGIHGAPHDQAPVWAVGWDKRSLLLNVMEDGQWHTFRLPKADYSYDGDHGWHTEWPRIREVVPAQDGQPARYLMNMHGGWFNLPGDFSASHPAGLRPIGSYIKVTGDFTHWNGRIVFGCDDTAKSGFLGATFDTLNSLNDQSNSNLWFTTWERLHQAGRPAGFGGVWAGDGVKAGEPSDPYLLAGYTDRVLHISHTTDQPVTFAIEIDAAGTGRWTSHRSISVVAGGYAYYIFPGNVQGQWVRLTANQDAAGVTAYLHYGPGGGAVSDSRMFAALADIDHAGAWNTAVQHGEGDDTVLLAAMGRTVDSSGKAGEPRHYRVGADMKFGVVSSDSSGAGELPAAKAVIESMPLDFDEASVIVVEGEHRYRLPRATAGYEQAWPAGWYRAHRELVTERSLLNAAGIFYVLPRANSGGVRRIKPVAAHNKRIVDFCTWRGLTVLSGTRADARPDGHYFASRDGSFGLWFGDIDDLWKLGKPRGTGGPWYNSTVKANVPSDPYLMTGFDQKRLEISHETAVTVNFTVEIDFLGAGRFVVAESLSVPAGKTVTHEFPPGFAAHWVRLTADAGCSGTTATFIYE